MEHFLFSLALVPVQEWIVEARRSRDLRAGSVFLWWLMAKVLAAVEDFPENRIVLPLLPPAENGDDGAAPVGGQGVVLTFADLAKLTFADALQRDYGIPNRASGYFAAADAAEAAARLAALEAEVVHATWRQWTSEFLESRVTGRETSREEREFWKLASRLFEAYRERVGADGDCPFSLMWVAKPVAAIPEENDEGAAARHLEEIEHLVRDVKRSRPIRPWPWGAPVGKCNQCGRREAMGPAARFDDWREFHDELRKLEWVEKGYRIDPGERLCWVCFTRRMAGYAGRQKGFPSTYQVAASTWIELVRQAGPEPRRHLVELESSLETGEDVGSVVIQRLAPDAGSPKSEADRLADELLRAVRASRESQQPAGGAEMPAAAERQEPLPEAPNRYLALLAFDGDRMGQHVHAKPFEISAGMAEFGRLAHDAIGEHQGKAFYLGGDEGLAMAPAIRALPLALALRKAFDEVFSGTDKSITLSLGLAFFQCTSPIAGGIRAAQDCLDRAKSLDEGKDALAVTVLTASGTTWTVAAHWGEDWDRLARAAEMVRSGDLAGGWAYDAEHFVEQAAAAGGWADLMQAPETVRDEVKRLLRRRLRRPAGEKDWKRDEVLAKTWTELSGDLWWQPPRTGGHAAPLPEQFHLVGFLGRQSAGGAARGDDR